MTLETMALLAFSSVNLKVIFLALPILPSHVSPQRLRITFLLHGALSVFFILYCIVLTRRERQEAWIVECTDNGAVPRVAYHFKSVVRGSYRINDSSA